MPGMRLRRHPNLDAQQSVELKGNQLQKLRFFNADIRLEARRKGFIHIAPSLMDMEWERRYGFRLVDMDHKIKLFWQGCMEIMTYALGFRPVDHANRALQPFTDQHTRSFVSGPQVEIETLLFEP